MVALTILLGLIVPTWFASFVGSIFGDVGSFIGALAGFVAGGFFLGIISKRLFVYNEEWSGYVTNNPFGGQNVAYGPGLHFSYPWEQRNQDGEYDLQVKTEPFELKAQTKSANVTVTGSFQYRIDLPHITKYIGAGESTIKGGLIAFIKTFLTEELAKEDAEYDRTHLGQINAALRDKFTKGSSELERKYGIQTVNLFLETLQLPEEAQKTRDAVDEAKQLTKVVAELAGYTGKNAVKDYQEAVRTGAISHEQNKQLLDRAMAVSNNNARINVNTIEGGGSVTPMLPINNPPA